MRSRLVLLAAQSTALGLMVAFLVVPASTLFLDEVGAGGLPWVYLAVAVTGVLVSAAMKRAQARLTLAGVAIGVLLAYVVLVALAWIVLRVSDGLWVTFPLLVMFPLIIPIGFVLVGAQAGRLLDVRQMKAHLPKVFAGFSVGFALGGLLAAVLVQPVGGPANLLAVDVPVALGFLFLVALTATRFPDELRAPPPPPVERSSSEPRDRLKVLRDRLVVVVFGYQVLSAGVTQLLDYMVWERAAARYPDPDDLARFLGVFGAIINVVGVAFVILLAGRLLTRWGIGLGLAANPGGVLALLAVGVVVGVVGGPAGTLFFVIVCAQQVVDIALTDGMTRTSINTTYQALPARARLAAQTGVEGAGVPVALGLVGAFLLVTQALGLGVRVVAAVTLALSVVWLAVAVWAFREYGVHLRQRVLERPWMPTPLRVRDDAQRAAVERLLASGDPRDVSVAHTALRDTAEPEPERQVDAAPVVPSRHDPARMAVLEDVRRALAAEARRVAWLIDTGGCCVGAPGLAPLQSALRDEMGVSAQQATLVLGLAHGHDAVADAVAELDRARERPLALEFLEVTAGHGEVDLVTALVDPVLEDDERRRLLLRHAPECEVVLAERVVVLVEDPDGQWQEPWLRVCALYAAPSVLGAEAARLAGPWVDDPDPVVAETARWAVAAGQGR